MIFVTLIIICCCRSSWSRLCLLSNYSSYKDNSIVYNALLAHLVIGDEIRSDHAKMALYNCSACFFVTPSRTYKCSGLIFSHPDSDNNIVFKTDWRDCTIRYLKETLRSYKVTTSFAIYAAADWLLPYFNIGNIKTFSYSSRRDSEVSVIPW